MKNQLINIFGIIVALSLLAISNVVVTLVALGLLMFFMANLEARIDALKASHVRHWTSIYRVVVFLGVSVLNFSGWPDITIYTTYQALFFWIVFDLLYNYHKDISISYVGRTAFLDKLARASFKKNTFYKYNAFKLLLLFWVVFIIMWL